MKFHSLKCMNLFLNSIESNKENINVEIFYNKKEIDKEMDLNGMDKELLFAQEICEIYINSHAEYKMRK